MSEDRLVTANDDVFFKSWSILSQSGMVSEEYAVLQASEMGQPVYKRMGFRTVTSYKTYLRPG